MSKARAQKIKLILFDVDGVMTDGTIFLFPSTGGHDLSINEQQEKMSGQGGYAIHSQEVMEAKGFNAHDGTGISLAKLGGLKLGIITKRISQTSGSAAATSRTSTSIRAPITSSTPSPRFSRRRNSPPAKPQSVAATSSIFPP